MTARSLAFRTDLAVLARQGSVVEERADCVIARTPDNPTFRWGNFVLVRDGDDAGRAADLHAAAFPDADFTTVGVDDPAPRFDEGAWRAAGFEVERSAVLTASTLSVPHPGPSVARPLAAADWEAVAAIDVEGMEDDPEHRAFVQRRLASRRIAVERGDAAWFGVEADGRIVAAAGIVSAGDRTARFQDVGTLSAYRRRGFAAAVVGALGAHAVRTWRVARLVIVADPEGPAIGLYRRLGFRDAEDQVQLERRTTGTT